MTDAYARGSAPVPLLVVARWFPSIDTTARGRYVADQVEALLDEDLVRPLVASFEFVQLRGSAGERRRQRRVLDREREQGIARGVPAFSPRGARSRPGIPVARLPVAHEPAECRVPGDDGDAHRAALLAALPQIRSFFRLQEGDGARAEAGGGVVHAHTGYPDGYAAAALAQELGWPLVITEHATFLEAQLAQPEERRRYAEAVDYSSALVAVSETLAAIFRREFPDLGAKLRVIPNAVRIDQFSPVGHDRRDPSELLYVGALKELKATDLLLTAFARVREQRPQMRLRLVGKAQTAEQERAYRDLAARLGVADAVVFEGQLDRDAVAEAMARAALFVHPSRYETFGVVAAEALAAGIPLVATESGGVPEIMNPDPESFGALVPRDDPDALAAAILATLDRAPSFDPLALRARVEERYSASAVCDRLARLYASITRPEPAPRGRGATTPAESGDSGATPHARETRDAPSGGSPASDAPEEPLVVGFLPTETARLLATLPPALLGTLVLLTADEQTETHEVASVIARMGQVRLVALDELFEAERRYGDELRDAYRAARERRRAAREMFEVAHAWYLRARDAYRQRDQPAAPAPSETARDYALAREARARAKEALAASPTPVPPPRALVRAHHDPARRRARRRMLRLERARVAVEEALAARTGGALPPVVVCLGGFDLLACAGALRDGRAVLAPGTARWLADRWAARAEPVLRYPGR